MCFLLCVCGRGWVCPPTLQPSWLLPILSLFWCMVWGCVLVSFMCMQLSRFPGSNSCWIDWLFPILSSCLPCVRLIDHRCLGLFLGSLFCSIGLYVCFDTVPYCLDDFGFVILPEVWESYASCLVFVPQNCFGNSGSCVVPYKFWDDLFKFCENCPW